MSNTNTIDWETLAKSSKPRRTMGKFKMAPPQRVSGLSFDTPRDVTNPRESPDDRPLRSVPFANFPEEDEEGIQGGRRWRTNSNSAGSNPEPDHYPNPEPDPYQRDQSASPVPPCLKTFNSHSYLQSFNGNNLLSAARPHRSTSYFENSRSGVHSLSALHASNRANSNDTLENYRQKSSDIGRSRHTSQSPVTPGYRSRSMSSPSLHRTRNEVLHHQVNLTPLKEQLTPAAPLRRPPSAAASAGSCQKGHFEIRGKIYTIVDKIGSGGSSEVFRVLDENNSLKAVKQVDLSEVSQDDAFSFRKEVELLKGLKEKRRIVQIFDDEEVRRSDGRQVLYVVMEHGEKDLAHLLKEFAPVNGSMSGGLTDAKTKFYWEEMLEAVQVAHQEGIVHLDLKPANFLIVAGTIKLIDFGIASKVDRDKTHVTKDNQLGTLNFMSPESLQDESSHGNAEGPKIVKISYKSDVWSLGCILYNLVFGRLPFGHIRNPYQKICAILNPDISIEFPAKCLEHHDPLVLDVLKRCLERDPSKRASIEQLLLHPYLRKTSSTKENVDFLTVDKSSVDGASNKNVNDLLVAFSSLTPNSKKMLFKQLDMGLK